MSVDGADEPPSVAGVVHVITGLSQGGAEAMLEKLVYAARRLQPAMRHSVIVLGPLGVVGERMRAAGVEVEALHLSPGPRGVIALWRLWRRLRSAPSVTVVQTWLWHADLIGGLCARLAGNRRVVWCVRNSMPTLTRLKWTSRSVARACAAVSGWLPAAIVCNSRAALAAHAAIGYATARCMIIPNGFDVETFRPDRDARERLRAAWGIAPAEPLIGLVARMDPLKDHANFIDAAAGVLARHPDARFVLVGDGTTTDPALSAQIAARGLTERVRLVERQSQIAPVMSALDVFCLSSYSEGFPNVLGEAMACAVPCVTTDVGDAREIVGDPRWVVPPRDSRRLANAICGLLELSVDARRQLGCVLRARIATEFGINRICERFTAVYDHVARIQR